MMDDKDHWIYLNGVINRHLVQLDGCFKQMRMGKRDHEPDRLVNNFRLARDLNRFIVSLQRGQGRIEDRLGERSLQHLRKWYPRIQEDLRLKAGT